MGSLETTMGRYTTINADRCIACGNGWFFDLGKRLSCSTCNQERVLYEIDEDPLGYGTQTGATVVGMDESGCIRGALAYLQKYPPQGYGTYRVFAFDDLNSPSPDGKWRARFLRGTSSD